MERLQLTRYVFGFVLTCVALCPSFPAFAIAIRASEAGAHLNSDLLQGGGADDTAIIQSLLDRAANGQRVHVIIDGPARVAGLDVHGNTLIECTPGGGFYLTDNSSRAIIRNAHRSRAAITDENIRIRGCFLNGNRRNQPSADITRPDISLDIASNKEADGTYISGLQFLGVSHLRIENTTLWNIRAFGALIANADHVDIRNVTIDHGGGPNADAMEYLVTDGLHFKGPLRHVRIQNIRLRVGDDGIAFNANDYETDDITVRNDFGPYVGQGPISDVTVDGVTFLPGSHSGFRIFSTSDRVDRIAIRNVSGIVRHYFMTIDLWMNRTSLGNVGRVDIDNVNVQQMAMPALYPLISLDARIEQLRISNLTTGPLNKPVLRLGPHANLGDLEVDVEVRTVGSTVLPSIEFDNRAHAEILMLVVRRASPN
jgi:hypothetical protein